VAKTYLFWDPLSDNILQERDETGAVTAEYTTEPGLYGNVISQNRGGVESQFHYDAQGSTLAVTDDNQNVTDTRAYSAFGETTESTGTTEVPFQYIGQKGYYRDSLTGQYLVRRRPYEAVRARWISQDPVGLSAHANAFTYAHNNVLKYDDPSGTFLREGPIVWEGAQIPATFIELFIQTVRIQAVERCRQIRILVQARRAGQIASTYVPPLPSECKCLHPTWQNALDRLLIDDSALQQLLRILTNRGCNYPRLVLTCPCSPGSELARYQSFGPGDERIVVCVYPGHERELGSTLFHEFVHATQDCVRGLGGDCYGDLKDEMQAYFLEGECRTFSRCLLRALASSCAGAGAACNPRNITDDVVRRLALWWRTVTTDLDPGGRQIIPRSY
jgi:RHS repeat-associated protein